MSEYCLLLGLGIRYRERALTAAASLTDMPLAVLQPLAPLNSNEYVDIAIPGDGARDTALEAVRVFEDKTGLRPGAVVPLGEPTIAPGLLIAEHYNLPYLARSSVETVRNKVKMLAAFENAGLSVPRFMKVSSKQDLQEAVKRLKFPLIVKPSNLYSSVGVKFAPDAKSLETVFETCAALAAKHGQRTGLQSDLFHVEEFIPSNKEVVTLVASANGQHRALGSVDTALTQPPYFAELGHIAPCTASNTDAVHRVAELAAAAVSIDRGLSNIDIRIAEDGTPYIIELNARPAGNGIMNIFQSVFRQNLFKVQVAGYLSNSCVLPDPLKSNGCAGIVFLDAPPGRIEELTPPDVLSNSVIDLKLFRSSGDVSTELIDGFQKDGAVEFFDMEEASPAKFEEYLRMGALLSSQCFKVTE